MAIIFNQPVKHGVYTFIPGVPLAFDDSLAEAYFVSAGWAVETSDEPALTYPEGTAVIDPSAVFADGPNKGQAILPAVQQEA